MNDEDFTIISDNDTNWLIQHPSGSVEPVTKDSNFNQLLYGCGLWGVLRTGEETLQMETDDGETVTLSPGKDAREFGLTVGDGETLHLGEHQRPELIKALSDVYAITRDGDERDPTALVQMYDHIRENRIREDIVNRLAETPMFDDDVEVRNDGWYIHDYLLLTWDGEMYHPNTTTRTVSGSSVSRGASEPAYRLNIDTPSGENRHITLDGDEYRLTDREMRFIAKALFAVHEAPTPQAMERAAGETA